MRSDAYNNTITPNDAKMFGYNSVAELEHKVKWYDRLFKVHPVIKDEHESIIAEAFVGPDGHIVLTN